LWTYLIPLIPLTCWWDGLVSQWRAYKVEELLELTRGLNGYDWTAVRVPIRGVAGHVTYLHRAWSGYILTYINSANSLTEVGYTY